MNLKTNSQIFMDATKYPLHLVLFALYPILALLAFNISANKCVVWDFEPCSFR